MELWKVVVCNPRPLVECMWANASNPLLLANLVSVGFHKTCLPSIRQQTILIFTNPSLWVICGYNCFPDTKTHILTYLSKFKNGRMFCFLNIESISKKHKT